MVTVTTGKGGRKGGKGDRGSWRGDYRDREYRPSGRDGRGYYGDWEGSRWERPILMGYGRTRLVELCPLCREPRGRNRFVTQMMENERHQLAMQAVRP